MSQTQQNNKRIAKNTLLLYFRMLFLMGVNLYTSRVILQVLGVEDYGVYNAVAGCVTMFSMVSQSIAGAISRFFTFVLGQKDMEKLKRVFSTAIIIQLFLAIVVVILVEAVGVWFLYNKMTIPDGRYNAAMWVLQFAMITFIFNLWSTPYNAALIAHERMDAFAYIGLFEGVANLAIVYVLEIIPFDELIIYAALMCLVAFVTRMLYNSYCIRHFKECAFRWVFDRKLIREMFSFAGWNFIGATSGMFRTQGINILFNIYYGPVVNAARGFAVQVETAVTKFSSSFFTAVRPQITKQYAAGNIADSHELVFRSSRLGFLMLTALIIPIISEAPYILNLWLHNVPDHTIAFTRIILLLAIIESFSQPLQYLIQASGNIKKYQIVVGSFYLANFPVAWLILYWGGSSELAQISVVVFSLIALFFRVSMLKPVTGFPIKAFFRSIVSRCVLIFALCLIPAYISPHILPTSFIRFIISTVSIEVVFIIVTFLFGLKTGEKNFILSKLHLIKT